MKQRVLVLLMLMVTSLSAVEVQKAVFDCASKDMKFVNSRIWLVEQSAKELQSEMTDYEFIITIHSGCTQIVDKSSDDETVRKIQQRLEMLHDFYDVKIEACDIALNGWGFEKDDLLPFIDTVPNSITRVIRLQNDGYAFFPYH